MDDIRSYTDNRIQCQQLPALDLFQDINPMESYVSFEEHQQYLGADLEYAEYHFSRNGQEEGPPMKIITWTQ